MSEPKREITELSVCGCGTPLIWTFAFAGAEYYCVNCGGKYGMFGAGSRKATPALIKKYEEIKALWDEHVGGKLLVARSYRRDCPKCEARKGDHPSHATEEEKQADEQARIWLADQIKAAA